jgi:long-subunit fatty acid transport protein
MNRYAAATAALLASTAIAQAGGLDRSGLGISPIFEEGAYVELSFGSVMPSVSGTVGGGTISSGNMAQDFLNYSFAVRDDLSDRLSYAVMYEQAFGAAVDYRNADPTYPLIIGLGGNSFAAELTGTALTAMRRYELSDRFSVYGGLRYVTMSAEILFDDVPQTLTYGNSSDVGYLIGAAFEIPEIALRASLTYNSETEHNNPISNSLPVATPLGGAATETGDYVLPQSVNLDFQTGIAEGTLLLASVRWAEWTATDIPTQSALGNINYDNDVFTYSLGVARRFTDDFALLGRVTYEDAKGGTASNLAPTDGSIGLSVAGIYDVGNARITAGVNYTWLGDAISDAPVSGDFSGNSAWGLGVRVGFSF